NAGTWLIGRLQTERDKKRLVDGLEGAAAGAAGADFEKTIGALAPRVFLLHNTHETKPVVFHTRWALSYLAGPLTREQIRRLPRAATAAAAPTRVDTAPKPAVASSPSAASSNAPVLPPDLPQRFEAGATLAPFALGVARVHVAIPGGGVHTRSFVRAAPLSADAPGPDWSTAIDLGAEPTSSDSPSAGATFAPLPRAVGQAGVSKQWGDALADSLYRGASVHLFECKRLRLVSKPGESERDFRIRIAEASRSDRDAKVEKLRDQYASKLATLDDRIRRAEQAVAREKDQASSRRMTAAVSVGTTLLSAFLGRKVSRTAMGDAARSVRRVDRAAKQGRDVDRAEDSLDVLQTRRAQLEAALAADVAALVAKLDPLSEPLATVTVRPRKSDVEVASVVLLWRPAGTNAS
ncbi:MAG: ATP-binding protein, partial [Candidatus Latescibacteria bacterium]|nr:ATP-binding protein [Candidatus Latescibacterota bacterium]